MVDRPHFYLHLAQILNDVPSAMEKYFQYLLTDIEALAEQAPMLAESRWVADGDEESFSDIPLRHVKICDLIGLSKEVFPPEHLLTDNQVIELVEAIDDLWAAWGLHWEMPANLPVRNHYTTFVTEMDGDEIAYHPEEGGEVHICQYSKGKCCPFMPDESFCHCRDNESSAKHDIALWEEYVYSLGLDPYRDMTVEEEARFEEEMRRRRALKELHGEDILNSDSDYRLMLEAELTEEEQNEFLFALEIADELLGLILDDLSDGDPDRMTNEEQEDLDIPF